VIEEVAFRYLIALLVGTSQYILLGGQLSFHYTYVLLGCTLTFDSVCFLRAFFNFIHHSSWRVFAA
jgi:hypothetical protein